MSPPTRADSPAPRGIQQLAALLSGALIAFLALGATFGGPQTDFEEIALGNRTISHFARVGDDPVHCMDLRDADTCLAGHARRGGRPVVLWLGNSQLHAVNQYVPGQDTGALILHRNLAPDGLDVLSFSQPNANLQEHLVLYTWLSERIPIRALVLPLVFDDSRETGVRGSVARAIQDPAVLARLQHVPVGRKIVEANGQRGSRRRELAALAGTMQQPVEAALVSWLHTNLPLWAERPQMRGSLFVDLHRLRNTVLGIEASTVRRTIPARKSKNLASAEALLQDSGERGVATIAYLVPLRGDVKPRHVPAEYAAFRREVMELALRSRARFADFETLIPVRDWGSGLDEDGADLDVQHFRTEGHAVLAGAVEHLLRETLADTP